MGFQKELEDCTLCPRVCHVNRVAGELGYCRAGAGFQIGSICLHRGEEPVLGGGRGVCNVFFTHCNLQCTYCQNHQISRNSNPEIEYSLSLSETAGRVERVLDQGIQALGLVSPTHMAPQASMLLDELRLRGRNPVVIYNTHAYDRVETLKAFESKIGVYLPDFKYRDSNLAKTLSDAPDYPDRAAAALREMIRQKGIHLDLDADGAIRSGVIVRHLVLPGQVENSLGVLRFLADEFSTELTLSLMSQYAPLAGFPGDHPLGRGVTSDEYAQVLDEMDRLGFENGWAQELESREHYCPDFAQTHPFE